MKIDTQYRNGTDAVCESSDPQAEQIRLLEEELAAKIERQEQHGWQLLTQRAGLAVTKEDMNFASGGSITSYAAGGNSVLGADGAVIYGGYFAKWIREFNHWAEGATKESSELTREIVGKLCDSFRVFCHGMALRTLGKGGSWKSIAKDAIGKAADSLIDLVTPDVKIHGDCGVTIIDKSIPPGGGITLGSMGDSINLIAGQSINLAARDEVEIVGTGNIYDGKLGKLKKHYHTQKNEALWFLPEFLREDIGWGRPKGEYKGGVTLRQGPDRFLTINSTEFATQSEFGLAYMEKDLFLRAGNELTAVAEKGCLSLGAKEKDVLLKTDKGAIRLEAMKDAVYLQGNEKWKASLGKAKRGEGIYLEGDVEDKPALHITAEKVKMAHGDRRVRANKKGVFISAGKSGSSINVLKDKTELDGKELDVFKGALKVKK